MLNFQLYRRPLFWLIIILTIKAGLGWFYTFSVPLWVGYTHEMDTYNVSRIILENGRLPIEDDFPPGQFEIRQGSQPPLYNLLSLPIVEGIGKREVIERVSHPSAYCVGVPPILTSLITDQSYNPPYGNAVRAGYALRLLNVAYTLGAVVAVYIAGRVALPQYAPVALVSAGILALEPYHVQLSAVIINDNLLLLIASIHLMLTVMAIRGVGNRWLVSGFLLLLGILGILTKVSGWLLMGVSIGTLALVVISQVVKRRPSSRQVGIAVGIIMLLAGVLTVIGIFNVVVYGGIFGRYDNLVWFGSTVLKNADALLRTIIPTFDFTLFDYRSAIDRVPLPSRFYPLYELSLGLLVYVPIVALVIAVIRRDWELVTILGWCIALFVGAVGLVLVRNSLGQIIVSDSSVIYAPIRYYAVGIPALAFSISLGSMVVISGGRDFNRLAPILGIGLILGWFILNVGAVQYYTPAQLMAENRMPFNLWQARTDATKLPLQTDTQPITSLGYVLHPLSESNRLNIDLFMRINEIGANYNLRMIATDANGQSLSCDLIPLRGLYPTGRWQAQEVVVENVDLPNCGTPLEAPIQLQVNWVDPQTGEAKYQQHITEIITALPVADSCPPNLGVVDGSIRLVKHIPERRSVAVGEVFKPIVSWLILQDGFSMWSRTFTIVHDDTQIQYSCTGSAGIHSGNSQRIEFGEIFGDFPANYLVEIDTCVIPIPLDAPIGTYKIYLSATDKLGKSLPIQSPNDTVSELLLFDTMTVTPR